MLVWLLLNGVNLVHLGRINLDFQQFHRLTLFSFIAVATLAVQWVAFYRLNGFAWSVLQVQSTWIVRLISVAQAIAPNC